MWWFPGRGGGVDRGTCGLATVASERRARYLKKRGMRILLRGYRTANGEIDLIARDGDVLVFVEVKTRRRGQPAEAVTLEKRRRITLATLHFLKRQGLLDAPKPVALAVRHRGHPLAR